MIRFEELIKSVLAMPSVIIHLGAGTCSEYESYNALNSKQLIFVEPDQYLAESAADTFKNKSHIKIIPCAIAAKNGQQILNITNNRRFSSLLLPGDLLDYYPNIKVDDKAEVEAITLTKLCHDEEISKCSDNLLVAELQGMEKEVFPTTEVDTLQRFKWIIIRTSTTNLYTTVSDNARRSLSEVMLNAGFIVLVFEEDTPPFTNILCIRNDAAIDNNQLKVQEANLVDTIRILEHNLSKQLAKLDDLEANHIAAMTELQISLTSKSDELAKVQTLLQSITAKREDLLQQVKEHSRTVDARSDELAQAQTQILSLKKENANQLQLAKELADSVKVKEKELTEMQQTLRINNKLILKSDSDLRDLQLQYRAALQHQEQQHTLLCELKEKLHQASEFYQKLNLQNLVFDADLLEQSNSDTADSHSDDKD